MSTEPSVPLPYMAQAGYTPCWCCSSIHAGLSQQPERQCSSDRLWGQTPTQCVLLGHYHSHYARLRGCCGRTLPLRQIRYWLLSHWLEQLHQSAEIWMWSFRRPLHGCHNVLCGPVRQCLICDLWMHHLLCWLWLLLQPLTGTTCKFDTNLCQTGW